MNQENLSKTIAFALRHRPQQFNLALNKQGWVSLESLVAGINTAKNTAITVEQILTVVANDNKQRFAVKNGMIRANQGHTVSVNLGLTPKTPPATLFHGTIAEFVPSIRKQGLKAGKRTHVHLSATVEVATQVGARRGNPVILTILAEQAHKAGVKFYQAENGVWLTEHLPAKFIAN